MLGTIFGEALKEQIGVSARTLLPHPDQQGSAIPADLARARWQWTRCSISIAAVPTTRIKEGIRRM